MPATDPGPGVYVHVPFCRHRCDYCDFATWTDRAHLIEAYVDACVTDLDRRLPRAPAATAFFGGGTPSLLAPDLVARLVAAIDPAPGAEVTLEANPDTVDPERLAGYRRAGVNRLSLGVQSFRPAVLAALGRTHDPANVTRAVDWARAAGFDDLSVDLIYGVAGESDDDWRATIAAAVALEPTHVSAYALTVEPGTALGARVAAGEAPAPDDDDQARKYEIADDVLAEAGYEWYEISNWARPGHESRHNLGYWSAAPYLGIGCSAHGRTAGVRWWTVRTPERYVERIATGASPEAGRAPLDATAAAEERFALALRTRLGARPGAAAVDEVERLAGAGLLTVGDAVVLTRRGRLLATDVTARLLLAGAAPPGRDDWPLDVAGTR